MLAYNDVALDKWTNDRTCMPPPPRAAARRRRYREPLPFLEGTRLARLHVQLNHIRTVSFRRNVKALEPAISPVALATLSRILSAYPDGLTAIWTHMPPPTHPLRPQPI